MGPDMTDETETAAALQGMFSRVAEIKAIGGVALSDVVDGRAAVPVGWVLDVMTDYYVPAWWLDIPHDAERN
jgi:hypothetical protein